ncbi:hypothetical protein E5163_00905 [Marinicauda algicola]|uniref:SMP-30/Gluconolactonase/LRE-like region domain-containing protein n=1 Tax=Marinicauda algicola TaxID=2029849 RepID=A0A4S2H2N0_9PROT|nr:SMP-30/gluconolactonase/LRE family protein [Marinicauda algicola]TGY89733.1 hypothetical protein E5163_00905 [Marinicauda algicola]
MRTFLIGLVIVVLALALRMAFVVAPAAGTFADLEETGLAGCEALTIAPGTEDVTIHPVTGLALVSTAERRGGDSAGNAIWSFDPADPQASLTRLTDAPEDFVPHGISLLVREGAPDRLFVVNHPRAGGHRIEIFEFDAEGALTHVDSITYPELSSPNDVLAVGPRSFYATNDRRYAEGLASQIEAFFGLPLSGVSYFDGEAGRIAADGLIYANGINMSADGRFIYVAEFLGRRVNVYRRAADGSLERVDRIAVHTGADNIEIGPEGDLWIGAHPDVFAFLDHLEDPGAIAPSEVVRVDPETGTVTRELVALNGQIDASSVAAASEDNLIVGAVFDDHVLICPR